MSTEACNEFCKVSQWKIKYGPPSAQGGFPFWGFRGSRWFKKPQTVSRDDFARLCQHPQPQSYQKGSGCCKNQLDPCSLLFQAHASTLHLKKPCIPPYMFQQGFQKSLNVTTLSHATKKRKVYKHLKSNLTSRTNP